MSWVKGGLFYFCKVIVRIAVQFKLTHLYQRVVAMRPNVGKIERMDVIVSASFSGIMNIECQSRKITVFNRVIQITLMCFAFIGDQRSSFIVTKIFNTRLGKKMIFYPEAFIIGIDKSESMTADIDRMEKTNLCDWICDNGYAEDFDGFAIVFDWINELLLTNTNAG